jgi:hypothetical protein
MFHANPIAAQAVFLAALERGIGSFVLFGISSSVLC